MIWINHEKLSEKLSDKIDEFLRLRDAQVFETYCDILVYHNSSWGFWVFLFSLFSDFGRYFNQPQGLHVM